MGSKSISNKTETNKRIYEIYKDLISMMTVADIVKKYSAEFGVSESTIRKFYLPKAFELADESINKSAQKILSKQIATITKIGSDALQNGKYREALQATDQLNKLSNLYTEKIELETKGNIINLQFAGFNIVDEDGETPDNAEDDYGF
ncbi:hypothetical protein CLV62_1449 [Dysgonomonas alginatilytica]|uniref:Uncharacterized protein n=1 Tax=Dysgonomonas alginatilytica TaxID=1605892 RepID=A0A2V3PHX5_9BACT|nr:hypothetical protein [Dysgonomonas alginatilytica]PXV58797.1 hypothetical protein CLV62_1449 [Dysgonomonas alginatilytica]